MRIFLRFFAFLIGSLCAVSHFAGADFEIIDAIREFGERRYVETTPSNIRLGPLQFHPTLKTKVQYDDNVFLEDQDEKEDIIFTVRPGVIIDLPINRHQLVVGYAADMEFFTKSRHRRQNDQNQILFALLNLNFPSWYINVLERFEETSSRAGTTFTNRIPRYDQVVHPKIGYRWKRLVFEAGFRHFLRDFRRSVDRPNDFQTFDWTGVIYYDLFARLKALLEYQFTKIDYGDNPTRNGNVNQVRIGLEGELRPNLYFNLRLGPQFRNYRVDSETNFNSWIAAMRLDYQARENLNLSLTMKREAVEANFANVNFYVKHLIGVGSEYFFLPRWSVFSLANYYRNHYQERAIVGAQTGFRRDHHFNLKTGIRYLPRPWAEIELAYELARRESNFSTFDYVDNRFSLSSAIRY